jgi:hypothetical protein
VTLDFQPRDSLGNVVRVLRSCVAAACSIWHSWKQELWTVLHGSLPSSICKDDTTHLRLKMPAPKRGVPFPSKSKLLLPSASSGGGHSGRRRRRRGDRPGDGGLCRRRRPNAARRHAGGRRRVPAARAAGGRARPGLAPRPARPPRARGLCEVRACMYVVHMQGFMRAQQSVDGTVACNHGLHCLPGHDGCSRVIQRISRSL